MSAGDILSTPKVRVFLVFDGQVGIYVYERDLLATFDEMVLYDEDEHDVMEQDLHELKYWLATAQIGHSLFLGRCSVHCSEMTEEKLEALPEWDGEPLGA